jgi:hypothetical protein
MTAAIAAAPQAAEVSPTVTDQLTMSYAGAEAVAEQYPQYASQITEAAKASFLDGDDEAYLAGILAVLVGAALVFFVFPKADREREVLAEFHRIDAGTKT